MTLGSSYLFHEGFDKNMCINFICKCEYFQSTTVLYSTVESNESHIHHYPKVFQLLYLYDINNLHCYFYIEKLMYK